jgi:peptide chain release factor 1
VFDKLRQIESRHEELSRKLADAAGGSPAARAEYAKLAKATAELEPVVSAFGQYKRLLAQIEEAQTFLGEGGDAELRDVAQLELQDLRAREGLLEARLRDLLLPKDPADEKNVLVEIRAGAGGDEAALFAAELARMYMKYAERQGWKVEVMDSHPTGQGGFKEVIFSIQGKGAWSRLKFERGVHRVQRIPVTESAGRIHTSTVTVAVLPEAEEVDVKIDEKDIKVDVYRASGPGGQGVNTTDSAVRLTHLPTGLVVTCQDERSQIKNRAKALRVLRARLLEQAQEEQRSQIAAARKSQVGTGERSERIRTYNFPQGRVTDHRIGLTVHRLPDVLEGSLDELADALLAAERAEQLQAAEA